MSLYHRYRPRSFDEMIGNENTIALLKADLAKKEKPHAMLLMGPSGNGKTTLARIIAKELGCLERDFIETNTADFRGIDHVREMIEMSKFKAITGTCRVWLLDESSNLTKEAQFGLLKLLEDAPPHVYFILATTNPEKLIETIRNRCSHYKVAPPTEKQMYRLLKHISHEEGVEIEREVLEQIILDSACHPRTALQILDQTLSAPPEQRLAVAKRQAEIQNTTLELCRALVGRNGWKKVANILSGLKDEDPEGVRRAVLGYCSAILLKGESANSLAVAKIMEQMTDNLFSSGYAGLVYQCFSAVTLSQEG